MFRSFLFFFDDSLNGATRRSVMGNHELAPIHRTLHLTWLCGAQATRIAPLAGFPSSCKKSDARAQEKLRRKYLLRGSIVLTHCVLPPVHIWSRSGLLRYNKKVIQRTWSLPNSSRPVAPLNWTSQGLWSILPPSFLIRTVVLCIIALGASCLMATLNLHRLSIHYNCDANGVTTNELPSHYALRRLLFHECFQVDALQCCFRSVTSCA